MHLQMQAEGLAMEVWVQGTSPRPRGVRICGVNGLLQHVTRAHPKLTSFIFKGFFDWTASLTSQWHHPGSRRMARLGAFNIESDVNPGKQYWRR